MMNSVLFNNVTICEECRDLYNSMLFSQTKFELENKKSDLLSRVSNNPDAEEFIKESGKSNFRNWDYRGKRRRAKTTI